MHCAVCGAMPPEVASALPVDVHPSWYAQRGSWDCGVACLVMAFVAASSPCATLACHCTAGAMARHDAYARLASAALELASSPPRATLEASTLEAPPPSPPPPPPPRFLWTIELALSAQVARVSSCFVALHSTLLGVAAEHGERAYYGGVAAVSAASKRVANLFACSAAAGLHTQEHHVPLTALRAALSRPGAAVVALVDMRRLSCPRCALGVGAFTYVYAGHFILLRSYDAAVDAFEYADPAVAPHGEGRGCVMSASALEDARTAAGTDQDLIEIVWEGGARL